MPAFSHLKWSPIGHASYFQIQYKVLPVCSSSKFSCLPQLPGRSSSKPFLDMYAVPDGLISSFHTPSLLLWPLVALACWSLGFPDAPVGCSQLSSRDFWERWFLHPELCLHCRRAYLCLCSRFFDLDCIFPFFLEMGLNIAPKQINHFHSHSSLIQLF